MEQNTQNTALLLMDLQAGILAMLPEGADARGLLSNAAKAIATARSNGIPVIYVVVGFRQGAPEVSMNNKSFGASREKFAATDMNAFMQVHPDIAPADGEITVTKRRVSAFTGSDLEVILRAKDIKHLVLGGVATSGCVLSTVREAADKDYRLTILADCCADGDQQVHEMLTTKVFTRQAEVLNVDDWK
jgi:nicotinamidase-related amidase